VGLFFYKNIFAIFLFDNYLLAVNPLPPGKSKVREFVESLLSLGQRSPQTQGAEI